VEEESAENSRRERKKMQRQAEKNYLEILSKIKGERQFPNRDEGIEQQRRQLPINGEEQPIVEAINEAPVVIICGETGSGKTTQVPQFCYEAGYTSNGHLIGVTEPRRIAAMSMANRVGVEMAVPELSSYQVFLRTSNLCETCKSI
jgi:ATP-dependent RNA helicase DHX37/DHR1